MTAKQSDSSNSSVGISSSRATAGSGLATLNDDMERLMECPVCTEILMPPIYTCETGHTICSDCKPKLKFCVMCKSPYTVSRNFSLESIVGTAKFYCENRFEGCTEIATADELKKHHCNCFFRPMKCHLGNVDDCKVNHVKMSQYADHLQQVHNPRIVKCSKLNPNVFPQKFECSGWEDGSFMDRSWTVSLFYFDGRVFANRVFTRGSIFYFKFYLIGEENDAFKYAVKVTIHKSIGCQVPKYELTTAVPSIRQIWSERKVLPSVALHRDMIESLGTLVTDEEKKESKTKLRWICQYEIIIVQSDNVQHKEMHKTKLSRK